MIGGRVSQFGLTEDFNEQVREERGDLLETSAPGIFACGDVRLSPVKRVASAVGEGSMAIAFVHQYLAYSGQTRRGRTLIALKRLLRSARSPLKRA